MGIPESYLRLFMKEYDGTMESLTVVHMPSSRGESVRWYGMVNGVEKVWAETVDNLDRFKAEGIDYDKTVLCAFNNAKRGM